MKLTLTFPSWRCAPQEAPILPTHTKPDSQHDDTLAAPPGRHQPKLAPGPKPHAPWHLPHPHLPGTPQQWADGLWYVGHVMGAGSLLSRYTLPTAAVLVCLGQFLVIISRPIGRIPAAPPPGAADDLV